MAKKTTIIVPLLVLAAVGSGPSFVQFQLRYFAGTVLVTNLADLFQLQGGIRSAGSGRSVYQRVFRE